MDCHPSLLQSYRAELASILAIYLLLQCLQEYSTDPLDIEVTAHVDNILAVNANNQVHTYPR
eukprot:360124-Ditylum_brightwellii.AAC.1